LAQKASFHPIEKTAVIAVEVAGPERASEPLTY